VIGQLEYISTGVHTDATPRGLNPALWAPGKRGANGIADKLCPMLNQRSAEAGPIDVVLWCPGGVEMTPTLTISDTPFENAAKLDRASNPWVANLLEMDDWCQALGRIRYASRGGTVWFYIGAPTRGEPDAFILRLVKAGLVGGIIFDAIALGQHPDAHKQFEVYQRAGAQLAYEANTTWKNRHLWADPAWVGCSSVVTWAREMGTALLRPYADGNHVPWPALKALNKRILLLDVTGSGGLPVDPHRVRALAKDGYHVCTNLLERAWTGRPLSASTANPDEVVL
jgi:hypothetical protein